MAGATIPATTARLKGLYASEYQAQLLSELGLGNVNQVPKLKKIVVSVGIGKNKDDKRFYEAVVNTLRKVTGQQPVDRMAKKSIAGFKIRKGMNRIGVSVTLRGDRMYEFLDRLVNVALPRVRDFHGVGAKGFDRAGNYNLGINDQSIFAELSFEDTLVTHGMQITFVIDSLGADHSRALLTKFGMPFARSAAENNQREGERR